MAQPIPTFPHLPQAGLVRKPVTFPIGLMLKAAPAKGMSLSPDCNQAMDAQKGQAICSGSPSSADPCLAGNLQEGRGTSKDQGQSETQPFPERPRFPSTEVLHMHFRAGQTEFESLLCSSFSVTSLDSKPQFPHLQNGVICKMVTRKGNQVFSGWCEGSLR